MTWQDATVAAGQVCFLIAQVGMIRRRARVPLFSACLTAFWLFAFVVAFGSRGWWASSLSCAAGAVNWTVLAWRNRKVEI